jgi:DNA-binding MarR family transcriptional regulator
MTDSDRIMDGIRRFVRQLRVADHAGQSKYGLSSAQRVVLRELAKGSALSLSEIADRTRTDQSSVSAVVRRLVEAGNILRKRDPEDARRLALTLTERGLTIAKQLPRPVEEQIADLIGKLPPAERSAFTNALLHISEVLAKSSQ